MIIIIGKQLVRFQHDKFLWQHLSGWRWTPEEHDTKHENKKSLASKHKKSYNENAHKSQGFSEVLQNFLPNLI